MEAKKTTFESLYKAYEEKVWDERLYRIVQDREWKDRELYQVKFLLVEDTLIKKSCQSHFHSF